MSTSGISPTERQRLAGLRGRLDKLAGYAVAESIDVVSVEDTACGAASVAIGRLLEALEATEAILDEHRRANDQIMGQNVAMSAEIAALKKGVRSLMEIRKKWKRRALHGSNALDRDEWAGVDLDVLPTPLSNADRAAILARIQAERLARQPDVELAEDRADGNASQSLPIAPNRAQGNRAQHEIGEGT